MAIGGFVPDWRYDYRPDESRDEKRLKIWRQQMPLSGPSKAPIVLFIVVVLAFSIFLFWCSQ
jgi:hypothetical protein